ETEDGMRAHVPRDGGRRQADDDDGGTKGSHQEQRMARAGIGEARHTPIMASPRGCRKPSGAAQRFCRARRQCYAASMKLEEIATDVYACLTPDRGLGWANSGFLNRAGGMVVDTFWDLRHTEDLIAMYRRVAAEPARR